jgi:tetratricopeptide (TPR) repeat protein
MKYEQALKLSPNNLKILSYAGMIKEILNKKEEALNYFRKILELDPNNESAKTHLQLNTAQVNN